MPLQTKERPKAVRRFAAALPAALLLGGTALPGPARAELTLEGEFVQGGLVHGRTEPDSQVRLGERPVRVSRSGRFVIGFGRDAAPRAELVVKHPGGREERRILEIRRRNYEVQRIDGLPERMVTPPPEVLARIRAEAASIARARARDSDSEDFAAGFLWPLEEGTITGVYGNRRVLNGQPRQPHYGVDIAAPQGTVVYAPASGSVSLAHEDMYFSGGTLIIDHGHGLSSTLIHMSELLVAEGSRVDRGQPIGKVGATGRATGPHLDWRINWFKQRLDPQLAADPFASAAP